MKAKLVKGTVAVALSAAAGLAVIASTGAKPPPAQLIVACANASFVKVATGSANSFLCRQDFTLVCKGASAQDTYAPETITKKDSFVSEVKPPSLSKVGSKWRVEYRCVKSGEVSPTP